MSKKPIEIFKDTEQFLECCQEWQHRLFLDDWFIKFIMVDKLIIFQEDKIADGVCEYSFDNKEAIIKIYNGIDSDERAVCRNCAEQVIIHELLHLKQEYFTDEETFDIDSNNFHEYIAHQATEMMAKTLLMTKYNLDYDYFLKR